MAIQLVAGQSIAADFTLLHPIESAGRDQLWLALQESTQERVQVEVLEDSIDLTRVQNSLDQYKALIHPNILPGYRVVEIEQGYCLISAYRRNLQPLSLKQPLTQLWPQLKVIVEALAYAHSLGFAHTRLTPNDCLVGDDGIVYVKGFGLPKAPGVYIAEDQHPSPQSDVYSIAQIIFACATGAPLSDQNQSLSTPIDSELDTLLRSMIAANPAERPNDFNALTDLLDGQAAQSIVQSVEFSRSSPDGHSESVASADSAAAQHRLPRERSVVSTPVALAGLAALIVFAGLLFLFLPEMTGTPTPATTQQAPVAATTTPAPAEAQVEQPTAPAPLELARLEELKKQGVDLAAELLRRQVEVEDIGGRLWAGERYDQSTELGLAGDEAYREEQFQVAVDNYQAGLELLEAVLAEADGVFSTNLSRGENALVNGDYETAVDAYAILTRIKPEDAELAAAKVRADNLEQVVRLSRDAEVLERNGDLGAALEKFQAANRLDGIWQSAKDGIARINLRLDRNRFQDEMSKGFAAIASGDFAVAKAAFHAAQDILPNSKEPLDGLQQIELAKVQADINELNEKIANLESAGDWQAAIPLYEEILAISPGLNPAMNGLARAQEQAELKATLTKYIEQPQLMKDDDELRAARNALVTATRAGDHFRELTRDLSHLVSLARLEIQVLLKSDQRTDVTVYQVQHFGEISETQFALVPGVYTFVGKRPGFRDVYQEIHIKGDVNPVVVNVVCSERI